MAALADRDPHRLVAQCTGISWRGSVWRTHNVRYQPTDHGGSLRLSGRYHQAVDLFPVDQTWPALYLSLGPEVSLGEVVRHVSSNTQLQRLNNFLLSEIAVELEEVIDGRGLAVIGLTSDELCPDLDYRLTQGLAAAAVGRGAEGIIVPSCTGLGDNLVVFPDRMQPASRLAPVSSRALRLCVERSL